jgi:hypothetical protein
MEYDLSYDDSPSLKQTLADLLRGMSKKQAYQELGQGIQNTAKVIPSVVESLGRGAIAQVPGTFGDISELARQFAPETMQNVMGNRVAPTTEEILAKIPRLNPDYQGSSQHETIGGLISPAMPSLLRAGAKATQNMPIGNMIAYHGTPHEIQGAFDISKVGTGEGAQAYGHGMYFAESPKVAESYKDLSKNVLYTPEGKVFDIATELKHPNIRATLNKNKNIDDAIERAKQLIKTSDPNLEGAQIAKKELDLLENLKKQGGLKTGEGNLYKVDIPDKDIPNMLDWDKPLSQQPKSVQNALAKYDPDLYSPKGYDYDSNELGQMIYNRIAGLENVRTPSPTDANVKATNKLNELGITGIRYLDEGSRHKGGTSNFVVFDPKEVKILEKNGKPSRKDILEEQINKIEPTINVNNRNIPVTLHPIEARQGNKIEYVNTDKFENAFKKDETGYIGKGGTENAIGKRYQGVEEFLKTAPSMRASEAHVRPNGSIVFGDGRHRFAFLRDQGLDKIPISMDAESIKNAKKFGYID